MIKASELRIGNLIQSTDPLDKPIICHVTGIDTLGEGWIACGPAAFSENRIEGIPLTPEWLERMGFEECDKSEFADVTARPGSDWWEIAIHSHRLLITLIESHNLMCIYDENDNCVLWRKFLGFQYVHQLQNLYFALTGQEIEITTEIPLK